jgi:hypothetical protein
MPSFASDLACAIVSMMSGGVHSRGRAGGRRCHLSPNQVTRFLILTIGTLLLYLALDWYFEDWSSLHLIRFKPELHHELQQLGDVQGAGWASDATQQPTKNLSS